MGLFIHGKEEYIDWFPITMLPLIILSIPSVLTNNALLFGIFMGYGSSYIILFMIWMHDIFSSPIEASHNLSKERKDQK